MGDIIFKTILLKGESGGVASVEKTNTNVLVDTYTITYNDGTTSTFSVTNGKSITNVEKTSTSGLIDTYTISYNDGTTSTYTVTNGKGITTIDKTATNVLVDTYTITLGDGSTETFTVTNGKGITSISKTATNGLIDTYTISYNDGTTSTFTVTNGENSQDANLANVENHTTASRRYEIGEHIMLNGEYYVTKYSINQGATLTVGSNIEKRVIGDEITELQQKTKRIAYDSNNGEINVTALLSVYDMDANNINSGQYYVHKGTEATRTISGVYAGVTTTNPDNSNDTANPQNTINIFSGRNGDALSWRDVNNNDLYRGALVTSFALPYTNYGATSGEIDLSEEALGGYRYVNKAERNYSYAGLLEDTEEANISLAKCGVYLLVATSFTIASGAVYGSTVKLITADGSSGTPNILQLGQTSNAPCTITVATNNMLTIKNSANTRGTQYNLIRLM